jgi:membrane dipeptidase
MKKWTLIVTFCCLMPTALASCATSDAHIDALHREALVWDSHNDLSYRVLYEGLDIGQRLPSGHADIPRLEEGGVDVQIIALFVQNFLYGHPGRPSRQAHELLTAMTDAMEQYPDRVELARTASDIERIVAAGKIAMPLSIEGGPAIENSLQNLREFHPGISPARRLHHEPHPQCDPRLGRRRGR